MSGEAWQALGQVAGQLIMALGGIGAIAATAYFNRTRKERASERETKNAPSRTEDTDHILKLRDETFDLRQRNQSLRGERDLAMQQRDFLQQQLDFEKRARVSCEQENEAAWQIIRGLRAELGRPPA